MLDEEVRQQEELERVETEAGQGGEDAGSVEVVEALGLGWRRWKGIVKSS